MRINNLDYCSDIAAAPRVVPFLPVCSCVRARLRAQTNRR